MQTRAMGPAAGWSWLMAGFTVFGRKPGVVLGAAALAALCAVVPTIVQMLVQIVLHPPLRVLLAVLGVVMLANMVLYSLALGGFMRVLDDIRHAREGNALVVFEPFRSASLAVRLVGFGLCMMLIYVLFLAVVMGTVGRGLVGWYLQFLAQYTPGMQPQGLPALPSGSGLSLGLLTVFMLFYSGAIAIGIGQAALRGRTAFAALRDGVAGAFKNVLPLVVLAVCGIVVLVVLGVVFGIAVAVVMMVLAMVSKALMLIFMLLLYLAFLLFLLAFMMGINYAIWDDVAGGEDVPALPDAGVVG